MKHQELSRVCTMGERLTAANHYATEVFKSHSKELKGSWDNLTQMVDERATLLSLSVSFHDRQQKVDLVHWCSEITATNSCIYSTSTNVYILAIYYTNRRKNGPQESFVL